MLAASDRVSAPAPGSASSCRSSACAPFLTRLCTVMESLRRTSSMAISAASRPAAQRHLEGQRERQQQGDRPGQQQRDGQPGGQPFTPAGAGASISARMMAATAAGIHGRSRTSPRLAARSGLYQLASVITCA